MTTTDTAGTLRRRLVEQLVADDLLHDPELRRAAETVARETFLGPAIYKPSAPPGVTVWTPTRRADVPAGEWLRLTYENTTWVTQLDGVLAEDATGPVTGGTPALITADGLRGHADRAPYDVVIAFCSMRHIPYGLLRQIREGGTLLVTLAGWGFGHGLALLTADGSAGRRADSCPGTPRS